MRSLSPARAVPVILACLFGSAVPTATTLADAADAVVSSDQIIRQLNPGSAKGIEPTELPRLGLPIRFEFNSDRLTETARRQLDQLARALNDDVLKDVAFAVQGHTDSVGTRAYNRDLSQRRAGSVRRYLVEHPGIEEDGRTVPARIEALRLVELGLGEDFPLPGTAGDDPRNRRVEIVNLRTEVDATRNASTPTGRDGGSHSGRALLIGIERYRSVNQLIGTVNDARAMKGFVSARLGFDESEIRMLLDSEATRDNILRSIEDWLIAGTRPGDDVFLYFSGHGSQQRDDNGDEADGLDETLVPVDATIGADRIARGMIADDEIAALLTRLSGRRVYVVVDTCHSGTSNRGIGVDTWRYEKTLRAADGRPLRIERAETAGAAARPGAGSGLVSTKDVGPEPLDITVWAAVRADQKALVDEEAGDEPGSVFTRRLLWGARDGNADADANGIVTRSELHAYLLRESEAYCARHRHRCGSGLTPQLQVGDGGLETAAFSRGAGVASGPSVATVSKDLLLQQAERLVVQDEHEVELGIEPGTELMVGEAVDIVVRSERDGHLVLLDVDAAGNMVQIFPNRFSERKGVSDRIRAGETLWIPGPEGGFGFTIAPPLGEGRLMAIVAERSLQLTGLVSRHKDLAVVEHPRAYLIELHEALRAAGGADWGRATRNYEVVARQ